MQTTAGSLALAERTARARRVLVRRLRDAGAVILGKTNLSEWANFRSTRSTSGWSGRGGQTRNPYALDRNPCGSSSGSAAAVAASLAAVAVGTETDGSIVCPASTCGVVGIKPTLGLVSRARHHPDRRTARTPPARWRARCADAAALLGALAGAGPARRGHRGRATPSSRATTRASSTRTACGARGSAWPAPTSASIPGWTARWPRRSAAMRQAGAVLVDPADLPASGPYEAAELEVLLYEFKADLDAYLAQAGPGAAVRSLAELIAFNERAARARDAATSARSSSSGRRPRGRSPTPPTARRSPRCRRLARAEGIDAVLRRHRLDALVAPTNGPAWLTDPVNGDHYVGGSSTPAAVAGYPAVTVPAGFVSGLPVGVTFFGAAWSEGTLLRCAHAFEQATRARRAPTL